LHPQPQKAATAAVLPSLWSVGALAAALAPRVDRGFLCRRRCSFCVLIIQMPGVTSTNTNTGALFFSFPSPKVASTSTTIVGY
jgi:hypothetical protein